MLKSIFCFLLFLTSTISFTQDNLSYQKPLLKKFLDLVDVSRAPSVLLDDDKKTMILLYRDNYKSIEELSKEELRLGGLRIDPKTNIGSRVTYYNNVKAEKTR